MCIGGGSRGSSAPLQTPYRTASGLIVGGDPGLPQEAIDKGIYTTVGWQTYVQKQIADQQIAAQKEIAAQQQTFNQQQLEAVKEIQQQQQQQVTQQANYQSEYNQGQSKALNEASQKINDAFAQFSPGYFQQYINDYMAQVNDQLTYQRQQAERQKMFGLARQGLTNSQQLANATGLLDEAQGRTLADQIGQAQSAAGQLQTNIGKAKQDLLGQVAQAQSIGAPISTTSLDDVNAALDQQNRQISGITSNAGDVVSSLKAVPTVSTLGNIFAGALGGLGNYLGGVQAQQALNRYTTAAGLSGTNPNRTGSVSYGT